ncbi:ATP-dependent helicase HrpA, partial [Glaesserella parasuis 29755]
MQKNHKNQPLTAEQKNLLNQLQDTTLIDARRLARRIRGLANIKNENAKQAIIAEIEVDLTACKSRYLTRKQQAEQLKIEYPDLPVSARRDEILKLIAEHQVVVIAGETGSGKTTQLPKMCLELGRGVKGLIGHTQPRRIAARSVATRIAEELKSELGSTIGYKIRFNDQISDNTLVKLMTDGILLAEIQNDRYLNQYDTLIIDEAHERSLNNDFILGYLKQILAKRPDLKVIITSATIDVERFSKHFNNAPIIEVSGRTYPVEVRYRPIVEEDDQDQLQGILNAVDELQAEGRGDILIFMNGEREIRDTAEALQKQELRHTEILPLYARLSAAEQQRIFNPSNLNRIILATNVAETSLTIPNIKYVIDTGTARISRYSYRTKVQRLPIEPISQASANQRKGRCGRISEGICIRLYSEEDFNARPQFTDPEILRTNLASVILQMTALGLTDIASFPFVDAPDQRHIQDGIRLLEELGALGRDALRVSADARSASLQKLTNIGRQLAQLPIDPRLGRMVIEAAKNGSLHEVMMIVSALSIQDPRERPQEKQQSADDKHRRFADKESDFLAFVNLWHFIQEQQKELTKNQFRKLCQKDYLN